MMLEIWGRLYSSNVIPVIWTANELGLDYELHLAGGRFGKLDSEAFAQTNPNRLIPAIRDGDFALWESLAIVRYLSARYGAGSLCPSDMQTRAISDQWMEWCASCAFPPVISLFFATVRTAPDKRDPARIEEFRDAAHRALAVLDHHLADRSFVCGAAFTMGDIPLGCVAYRYFHIDVERPALPHVEAWYRRLRERPAYATHVMRPFGTNPDEWAALEAASASEGIV